jgi:hypothetical protein
MLVTMNARDKPHQPQFSTKTQTTPHRLLPNKTTRTCKPQCDRKGGALLSIPIGPSHVWHVRTARTLQGGSVANPSDDGDLAQPEFWQIIPSFSNAATRRTPSGPHQRRNCVLDQSFLPMHRFRWREAGVVFFAQNRPGIPMCDWSDMPPKWR